MLSLKGHVMRMDDIGYMTGTKDLKDAVCDLSDGIPGAITAMMYVAQHHSKIDPHTALGFYGFLAALDGMGVYGSRIWVLFKDVAGSDPCVMVALLRAVQMGIMKEADLMTAIDGSRRGGIDGLDIPEILATLKKRLPDFIINKEQLHG